LTLRRIAIASRLAFAGLALSAGCATRAPARDDAPWTPTAALHAVQGSRADVHSQGGDFGGYSVALSCADPSCVGIQPHGRRRFVGGARQQLEPLRSAISRSCQQIKSLFSSGVSGGCAAGTPALILWTYDWRDVDALVSCASAELVKSDSGDAVAICVQPQAEYTEDLG
jgi:hypothetical protein